MNKVTLGEGPAGGFRQRLYELRLAKGWSQSELARHVWGTVEDNRGYTVAKNRDRISAYENGKAVPERANLDAIARALGVSVEDLAPDLVLANPNIAPDAQTSAYTIKAVGNGEKAHIKVDAIIPFSAAIQIIALLGANLGQGNAGGST